MELLLLQLASVASDVLPFSSLFKGEQIWPDLWEKRAPLGGPDCFWCPTRPERLMFFSSGLALLPERWVLEQTHPEQSNYGSIISAWLRSSFSLHSSFPLYIPISSLLFPSQALTRALLHPVISPLFSPFFSQRLATSWLLSLPSHPLEVFVLLFSKANKTTPLFFVFFWSCLHLPP